MSLGLNNELLVLLPSPYLLGKCWLGLVTTVNRHRRQNKKDLALGNPFVVTDQV